jgi:hypothetical protein
MRTNNLSQASPNHPKPISEFIDDTIRKLACAAYNHGVHCEAKQIPDEEPKLSALSNEARQALLDRFSSEITAARVEDNHDWDTETFDPITVCRRCATTYQTRGNKPCKGEMAKIALREESLTPDEEPEVCLSCGFAAWRHKTKRHPCQNYLSALQHKDTSQEGLKA